MTTEDNKESETEFWEDTARASLGIDESEDVRDRFNRLSEEDKFAAMVSLASRLSIQSGVAMATLQDVFPQVGIEEYEEIDYTSLCRTWDVQEGKEILESIQSPEVMAIYSATRKAALDENNFPSTSGSTMTIKGQSPVLLMKGFTATASEEAHLCPSTGKTLKCDTWLYIAAACLGMPSEEKDRASLVRAVRGSYIPSTKDHEEGHGHDYKEGEKKKPSTINSTGLNRCPFNLVSFASQKHWFDANSGVAILPCMTMEEAKAWNGGPYSVVVLCSNGKTAKEKSTTAAHMAQQIQLQSADLKDASTGDLEKAHSILKGAIKACAFILTSKKGPDGTAKKLWLRYQSSLKTFLAGAGMDQLTDIPENSVPVPSKVTKPPKRLVSKIDLCKCAASGLGTGVQVAYPDPMLLAFKSSINWTREHEFQLMAEAEQVDLQFEPDGIDSVYMSVEDKSVVSALSAEPFSL